MDFWQFCIFYPSSCQQLIKGIQCTASENKSILNGEFFTKEI